LNCEGNFANALCPKLQGDPPLAGCIDNSKSNRRTIMLRNIALILVVAALVAGVSGCSKKVQLTIANHSDSSRSLQLTGPEETQTIGAVSAGGRLTYTLKIKNADLPAQCNLAAGPGSHQSFTVTEDSPDKWWFHITAEGQVAGPYGKKDIHTESDLEVDMEVQADIETIVD